MNPVPTFLTFVMAVGFRGYFLTERWLQEKGVSPRRTFALQRYALIPALIWAAVFVRWPDILRIWHSSTLLTYFIVLALTWNIQQFVSSYVVNTVSSMSAFSTLQYLVLLPLSLVAGTFFNHDTPNIYSVAAIAVLCAAFAVQPAHHEDNTRARFSRPLILIAALILLQTSLDTVNMSIYREALQALRPQTVLGVFAVTTMALCSAWTSFLPKRPQDTKLLRERWVRATVIPVLWFAASIAEVYAVKALPIYILFSIGTVVFALDTCSDLLHHRIRLHKQTIAFLALVLAGIGLAVYAVY